MDTININGAIGYIYLKHKTNNNHILLFSDNHSSQKYCHLDGKSNSTFISDFLEMKHSKVLLEEVPRINKNELIELWSSEHIQKLKNLYLKKEKKISIEGIDIRPLLIPFSLDVFLLNSTDNVNLKIDKKYIANIKETTLQDYLKLLESFFVYKHKYFIETLNDVYTSLKTDSELGIHFIKLKDIFINIKNSNKLDIYIGILVQNDKIFIDKVDELLSYIMEWYTIAKIFYDNKLRINKFIIHAGLDHTTKLNKILVENYGYEQLNSNGLIDINNINHMKNNDDNNCLKLPINVANQFGGYRVKYLKYKMKYIRLKNQIGGNPHKITNIINQFGESVTLNTEETNICIKNLIEVSREIYQYLLKKSVTLQKPISLISIGQSAAYICLSMLNLPIYDRTKVNIIFIPFSGNITIEQRDSEDKSIFSNYCRNLAENNIIPCDDVILIDKIESAKGLFSFEAVFKECIPTINILERISINQGWSDLLNDGKFSFKKDVWPNEIMTSEQKEEFCKKYNIKQFIIPCQQEFSTFYPRLITEYHFDTNDSEKFKRSLLIDSKGNQILNIQNNPLADMIIDISKVYNGNEADITSNQWYIENNK